MNWLQKIADVRLMYHGTSDTLLPQIQSEGIAPGRKLVWDEARAAEDDRSRASYGGIYFSNNFMTAYGAARTATEQFGGNRMLVMATLEMRSPSIMIDEDRLQDPTAAINRTFAVAAKEWWYMQWADNDFYDIDKAVNNYITMISQDWNSVTNEMAPAPGWEHPAQIDAIRSLAKDFVIATVMREIAIAIKHEKASVEHGSGWRQWSTQFPQFADIELSQAEGEYRRVADLLMQKTKFMANKPAGFIHNVRVTEPVSFRGANKIVLIARVHEDRSPYNDEAEIIYSTSNVAMGDLWKQMVERIGGALRIYQGDMVFFSQQREA